MGIELALAADIAALENLGRELERACQGLGLSPEMTHWVAAAGVGVWSAAVLAGAGEPRLDLDKGLSQVTLRMEYTPPAGASETAPPGLAAGLFSPPALRVDQGREGQRAFWAAIWEA